MAEIKIRNLPDEVLNKITILAKEKGYKSRNEFLLNELENIAICSKLKEQENNYHSLIKKILKVLEYNTTALNKFCEENLINLDNFEVD